MNLQEIIENSYHYVGNCINSFDEDGYGCVVDNLFRDVIDFAQEEEESEEITKNKFLSLVDDTSMLPTGNYIYLITKDQKIIMAYEYNSDVHYFFVK